jgi:hypothetical protein
MRFLLPVFILMSFSAGAQENPADLYRKARMLTYANKIDSALLTYEYIKTNFPDHDKANISNELGQIYLLYKHDTSKATLYYTEILNLNGIYLNRQACLQLANIYIGKKNYKAGLIYLQKAEKEFPHFFICQTGEWTRKTRLAYQFAQCYAGLNQHKKAIQELTHYMFNEPSNFGYTTQDSLEYLRAVDFYIHELRINFPLNKLKAEWAKALNELVFETEAGSVNRNWIDINCHFTFLGEGIKFPEQEDFFNNEDGQSYLEYYDRNRLMKIMEVVPAYKALNAL